jgi:tetratricopeptide (TPR) repeat protein
LTFFSNLWRLSALGAVALIILAAGAARAADDDEAEPWPDDHPRNELPMYGEGRLPDALENANRKLVHEAYKTGHSLTASSNLAMDRGWEALSEGDTSTAIRRFNQAWLLDRRNGAAYWGFGVILHQRDGDAAGALKMLRRAQRLQPDDPHLMVDYGRVLEESGDASAATIIFLDAVSLEPDTPYAYVGLVRSYLKENDLQNALLFALEGKDRGDPISDELIAALENLSDQTATPGASLTLPAAPEWHP